MHYVDENIVIEMSLYYGYVQCLILHYVDENIVIEISLYYGYVQCLILIKTLRDVIITDMWDNIHDQLNKLSFVIILTCIAPQGLGNEGTTKNNTWKKP